MKRLSLFLLLFVMVLGLSAQEAKKTALLLIDIQDYYFPSGSVELVGSEKAAIVASKVLKGFRERNQMVIHVKHRAKSGGEINKLVRPLPDEIIFEKTEVNAFINTELKSTLDTNGITHIVIVGMQTHMCLEAAARAATDFKYKVTVVEDACATRDLSYGDVLVPAKYVHYSTLATLKSYCTVIKFEVFNKKLSF